MQIMRLVGVVLLVLGSLFLLFFFGTQGKDEMEIGPRMLAAGLPCAILGLVLLVVSFAARGKVPEIAYTPADVLAVAEQQRFLLASLLGYLVSTFAFPLLIVTIPLVVMFVYNLSHAMKLQRPVLYAIASGVPLLGILVLVSLSQRATQVVRNAGFEVGLMGADLELVRKSAQQQEGQ